LWRFLFHNLIQPFFFQQSTSHYLSHQDNASTSTVVYTTQYFGSVSRSLRKLPLPIAKPSVHPASYIHDAFAYEQRVDIASSPAKGYQQDEHLEVLKVVVVELILQGIEKRFQF
jgi:hypothetical protein